MTTKIHYPRGSEWRKWDLHVHTPDTLKEDQFEGSTSDEKWEKFCKTINESKEDISVIGITDYLLLDNYKKFQSLITEGKITKKFDLVIPNLELRLTPVTADGKALNLHILVDPDFVSQIEERIYSKLTIKNGTTTHTATKDGLIRLGKSVNNSLSDDDAYKEGARKFVIDFDSLKTVFDNDVELMNHCIVVVSNSSNDGATGVTQHSTFFTGNASDLDVKRQAIYKFSKGIFSANPSDREYFLGKGVDGIEAVVEKCGSLKPCIHGCDAHTNSKVFNPDQNRFCWIKADPTFEGLKQIIYEPEQRVQIGAVKPDQKDSYKVIRKIKFYGAQDFPAEIEFSDNLNSIIGSRSSGKSALLAYIAHAVDADMTEKMIQGPGEGEDYHWSKISLPHSVEWSNGQSNDDSRGKVVYIRQNYLFEKSKDADEIKNKIQPVLFKTLPSFKAKYQLSETGIEDCNRQISDHVNTWFELAESEKSLEGKLKDFGDKKAVEKSKTDTEAKIQALKEKNKLSDDDIKQYQKISNDVSTLNNRIKEIDGDIAVLSSSAEESEYFSKVKFTLSPALTTLPQKIQDVVSESLKSSEASALKVINKQVFEYKKTISEEKIKALADVEKINTDNKDLIEKYRSNIELEGLVKSLNGYLEIIRKIDLVEAEIKKAQDQKLVSVTAIKTSIDQRRVFIDGLITAIKEADQSALQGIKFDVESGFGEGLDEVTQMINIKANTDFVDKGEVKVDLVRGNPSGFLDAIYSKKQKIIAHKDEKDVARSTLSLTEKVLFTAEMEGDKIGGFSEPTMTPGKRALFALRLILAESEDTWPLLIDQPEDDLDSRSIYDEVVPFLKEKKKERQIIMVSHNANLVIGSDSEQIIVANRNGNDRKNSDGKQFNYLTGSLEFTSKKDKVCADTLQSQGVCEHACEILDGGKQAFESRKNKYNIK